MNICISTIESCTFQREEKGNWENGLLLNDGDLGILDMQGNKVPSVWDYRNTRCLLVSNIDKILLNGIHYKGSGNFANRKRNNSKCKIAKTSSVVGTVHRTKKS